MASEAIDRVAHLCAGSVTRLNGRVGGDVFVAADLMLLARFSFTPETWARMIENPEDRCKAASAYIEAAGGNLHGLWYGFGEHDGRNLWEASDNISMASVVLAIGAGGALSKCETTVLLTVEETIAALGKAKSIKYRPPAT
jgi:uncharacterized protein with GYD domain